MPRLTNDLYLDRHRFLVEAQDFSSIFGVLPMRQQWELHRFYQTQSDHPAAELLRVRAELTRSDPSLPSRTGKSFAQVYDAFRTAYAYAQGDEVRFFEAVAALVPNSITTRRVILPINKTPARIIRVWGVARPEINYEKLVSALKLMAQQLADEQAKQAEQDRHDEAA